MGSYTYLASWEWGPPYLSKNGTFQNWGEAMQEACLAEETPQSQSAAGLEGLGAAEGSRGHSSPDLSRRGRSHLGMSSAWMVHLPTLGLAGRSSESCGLRVWSCLAGLGGRTLSPRGTAQCGAQLCSAEGSTTPLAFVRSCGHTKACVLWDPQSVRSLFPQGECHKLFTRTENSSSMRGFPQHVCMIVCVCSMCSRVREHVCKHVCMLCGHEHEAARACVHTGTACSHTCSCTHSQCREGV